VVSFTPRPLYLQVKNPWYPLDRRLGGPQSRSGRGSEEKCSQPMPGIEPQNPDRPARSLVSIPTELSRLYHLVIVCLNVGHFHLRGSDRVSVMSAACSRLVTGLYPTPFLHSSILCYLYEMRTEFWCGHLLGCIYFATLKRDGNIGPGLRL
jgi:hypothetical protein